MNDLATLIEAMCQGTATAADRDRLEILLRDPANRDAETLALGGAVYKRWWEYDGQMENLHLALNFYRAAWSTRS